MELLIKTIGFIENQQEANSVNMTGLTSCFAHQNATLQQHACTEHARMCLRATTGIPFSDSARNWHKDRHGRNL